MAVTIYDVARKAGVGIGTVSRALNNSPGIKQETKERIIKVANELSYKPHGVARSLARRKTHTVATVVPFFFNYFYMALLKRIQYLLSQQMYDLILYTIDRMDSINNAFDRVLSERKTDGLFIISLGINDNYASQFINSKVPVIMVDGFHESLDSISIANVQGAKDATEHLIRLGHKKVGMINGNLTSFPAKARLNGYRLALREHDLPYEEDIVAISCAELGEDGFNEQAGYTSMKKLISLGKNMPTAIFISSDVQALGAMRAAKEASIHIPGDLAVVGFDDIEIANYMGLTTMRQPLQTMAELSVTRLMKRIDQQAFERFQIELKAELVVRESCGGKERFRAHKD